MEATILNSDFEAYIEQCFPTFWFVAPLLSIKEILAAPQAGLLGIKTKELLLLAAPLAPAHGTRIGNHWPRRFAIPTILRWNFRKQFYSGQIFRSENCNAFWTSIKVEVKKRPLRSNKIIRGHQYQMKKGGNKNELGICYVNNGFCQFQLS